MHNSTESQSENPDTSRLIFDVATEVEETSALINTYLRLMEEPFANVGLNNPDEVGDFMETVFSMIVAQKNQMKRLDRVQNQLMDIAISVRRDGVVLAG